MIKKIAIKIKNLSKSFINANEKIDIFRNLNLEIFQGEIVGLFGASGSGKSTLLQILGLMQKPTFGGIFIDNIECNFENSQTSKILRDKIGFIYQFHYLFNDFNVLENLIIPQIIQGINKKIAIFEAEKLLEKINLQNKAKSMPFELSGGERQRIAILRALIKKPLIILADEPTGNLDFDNAKLVFNEMINLAKEQNTTLLMVTHNNDFKKYFDKSYEIKNKDLILLAKNL